MQGIPNRKDSHYIFMLCHLSISIKYENRVAYYEAFTSFHRDSDASPMIRLFAEAERARLADLTAALHSPQMP